MKNRFFKIGGLALGLSSVTVFGYDYVSRDVAYSKNLFLNEQQSEGMKPEFAGEGKTVVVVGAGILGVSSSYYLLKKGFNVILLEKRSQPMQEISFRNCCISAPSTIYPLVNWHNIPMVIKNIFNPFKDPEKGNGIYLSAFFEPYFMTFALNVLYFLFTKSEVEAQKKIRWLNKLSLDEYQQLFAKYPDIKAHSEQGGTVLLYEKEEEMTRYEGDLKRENIEYIRCDSAEEVAGLKKFAGTNARAELFQNYYGGLYLPEEFMMDTYELGRRMINKMSEEYPKQFQIVLGESLDKFIIEKESERVIGIETRRGRRLRSDAIVIACAVNSKHLVGKLKVSVPVMPFKGYTVSVKLDDEQTKQLDFLERVSIGGSYLFMTKLKHEFRMASYGMLVGSGDTVADDYYTRYIKDKFRKFVRLEKDVNFEGWMGHRPLVPDDVAVISRVGKHDNVVVATGVSGRGMTQCLGVGVVVSELLSGSKAENLADYDLKRFLFI